MHWKPLPRPLSVCWLVAELVVVGLMLWRIPAWRSLCQETATAPGQIISLHDPNHNRAHYRFQAGGRSWEGTTGSYRRGNNTSWALGDPVEVFYAPLDPSFNQTDRPPAVWWGYAMGFFFFYGVMITTMIVGMIQLFLERMERSMDAF